MDIDAPTPGLPVPAGGAGLPADHRSPAEKLYEAWLGGRSEQTCRAYRTDLQHFAAFCQADGPEAALRLFLALDGGAANHVCLQWRSAMLKAGLSPATINRRLAALRSLAKLGRTLGMVHWSIEIDNVASESYRDTRGPGRDGVRKLFEAVAARSDAKGLRDRAILRLLYDLGLRRGEASRLDLADVDLERDSILVLGKGKREKVRLDLPAPTKAAVIAWLVARGQGPGPLLTTLTKGGKARGRLTGDGVWRVVTGLAAQAGIVARPHGLRHQAVTRLLEITNGNVTEVKKFSRHASVETVMRYDDNRKGSAGDLSRRLAEDL